MKLYLYKMIKKHLLHVEMINCAEADSYKYKAVCLKVTFMPSSWEFLRSCISLCVPLEQLDTYL